VSRRVLIPVTLPDSLHRTLRAVKHALIPRREPPRLLDLRGDRSVEWSFLSLEMPPGPGEAIEFGCEFGYMTLLAAQKGFHVVANDLQEQFFPWVHPNVEFRKGDFMKLDLPENHFDIAINCSSVEHVGIAGRYGIEEHDNNGDIAVMQRLAEILKPSGKLLMTAPCGRDAVIAPWHRVYGEERLPRILAPFSVLKERYWAKNERNQWVETTRHAALSFRPVIDLNDALRCVYALGCFVLRKRINNGDQTGAAHRGC
jgi:SAM-dependent methyltransferase